MQAVNGCIYSNLRPSVVLSVANPKYQGAGAKPMDAGLLVSSLRLTVSWKLAVVSLSPKTITLIQKMLRRHQTAQIPHYKSNLPLLPLLKRLLFIIQSSYFISVLKYPTAASNCRDIVTWQWWGWWTVLHLNWSQLLLCPKLVMFLYHVCDERNCFSIVLHNGSGVGLNLMVQFAAALWTIEVFQTDLIWWIIFKRPYFYFHFHLLRNFCYEFHDFIWPCSSVFTASC